MTTRTYVPTFAALRQVFGFDLDELIPGLFAAPALTQRAPEPARVYSRATHRQEFLTTPAPRPSARRIFPGEMGRRPRRMASRRDTPGARRSRHGVETRCPRVRGRQSLAVA